MIDDSWCYILTHPSLSWLTFPWSISVLMLNWFFFWFYDRVKWVWCFLDTWFWSFLPEDDFPSHKICFCLSLAKVPNSRTNFSHTSSTFSELSYVQTYGSFQIVINLSSNVPLTSWNMMTVSITTLLLSVIIAQWHVPTKVCSRIGNRKLVVKAYFLIVDGLRICMRINSIPGTVP